MSTRRVGLLLVCLTYLLPQAGAQVASDPNDAAVSVLKKPESADAQYLSKNAGAVALAHGPGKLQFRNANGSKTAILGAVTHRDSQTGAWVPNRPVLSKTRNGWRLDGAVNDVLIKATTGRHTVSQTFTDFTTKRASTLALTVPTMSYEKDMAFQFTKDGLTWRLMFDQTGAFDLVSAVAAKRGKATYTFEVDSSETLTVNRDGHLVGNANVNLTRALMITRTGRRLLCSPWTYGQKQATFTCDDSPFARRISRTSSIHRAARIQIPARTPSIAGGDSCGTNRNKCITWAREALMRP